MRRYLIVANQTLGGEPLRSRIAACLAEGACRFYLVVPATVATSHRFVWTEGESRAVARRRLDDALTRLRQLGADVDGEVGDPSPMLAISDVLRVQSFDEIILSTLPPGISRWLARDLPHRVVKAFGLPVTLVVAQLAPVS